MDRGKHMSAVGARDARLISHKGFVADDGERVTIVEFEIRGSAPEVAPRSRASHGKKARGRELFQRIQVPDLQRHSGAVVGCQGKARRPGMNAWRTSLDWFTFAGLRNFRHFRGEVTMMKLYFAPHTCALASHIALEEAGAEYSTVRINFAVNEQRSPEYLAINPKGRVPALVTERGILTETPAMLAFIAQSFPKANLAPLDDPFRFAEVQAFNSYLCSTVHVAHAHRMRGTRWADDPAAIEAMKRKVPDSVAACFELIDEKMLRGPWVMGESYTICDPYLFTLAQWMEGDSVDPARFPKVRDHRNRMSERAAVRKAVAEEPIQKSVSSYRTIEGPDARFNHVQTEAFNR